MKLFKRTILGFLIAASVAGYAIAHKGATGIVKERMMAMKDIGGLMKTLAKLDWSDKNSAQAEVEVVADKLVAHSQDMLRLFPEGSNKKPSEALDVIWENKDGFAAAVVALEKSAGRLKTTSPSLASADDIKPLIKGLGKTCSGCHADFRLKKE